MWPCCLCHTDCRRCESEHELFSFFTPEFITYMDLSNTLKCTVPPPPPPVCISISPQASRPFLSPHLSSVMCQRRLLWNAELTRLPAPLLRCHFLSASKPPLEASAATRSAPHLSPRTVECWWTSGNPLVERRLTTRCDSFLEEEKSVSHVCFFLFSLNWIHNIFKKKKNSCLLLGLMLLMKWFCTWF